mgnify:CR=1 FL=1
MHHHIKMIYPLHKFVLYYFMDVKKELKKKDKTLNEIEKMYGGTI